MFQSYEVPPTAAQIPNRLAQLRQELNKMRIDAYLIPRGDEHRGEYVPKSAERLAWLTGFTGSAGLAIVGKKYAALIVDGRYTVQARAQVPVGQIEVLESPAETIENWIIERLKDRSFTIGFDPWLHSVDEIDRLKSKLSQSGIRLKSLSRNLVDRVWPDRPTEPLGPVVIQPLAKSGEASRDKVSRLQKVLAEEHEDAAVLTAPESICWLLNIRGNDIAHNPVVLSYAILPARGKVELFIETAKLNSEVRSHLAPVADIYATTLPESAVRRTPLRTSKSFADRLMALKQAKKTVRIDTSTCPIAIARRLGPPGRLSRGPDPCALPRATKNATELRGARAAHKRDAIAVCRFLAWLDRQSPTGEVDEIAAARQLEQFRRDTNQLREISFDTISGSGPNGAIVHYRVTTNSNRVLRPGELYLVDSGAQYQDGTTDITRTIAVGTPTEEMCDRFTRVLQGHISLATAVFPEGTRGVDLDPFARRALWNAGLDYDHGTGHGVGSYLSVHEGPQSISRRSMVGLKAGMILSNEPGYYREGAFGIRIENLIIVKPARKPTGGDRSMFTFETITLAPIDRRLIKSDMLTKEERTWLNDYHARVLNTIGPKLSRQDRAWLEAACQPI